MRTILLSAALALATAPAVTAQAWKLMQFSGSESFEFTLTNTQDGVEQTGRLALSMNSTGCLPQ